MKSQALLTCALAALLGLGHAIADDDATSKPASKPVKAKIENNKAFHAKVLKIAKTYKAFQRANDMMRWAPTRCAAPPKKLSRGRAIVSRSTDKKTHGRKLYYIFAKNPRAYTMPFGKAAKAKQPLGQVLVKEAWLAEHVETSKDVRSLPTTHAKDDDGKIYKATKKHDLFMMFKEDPKTAGTDKGWVYATVSADGKTVTSAGRVASCMSCHTKVNSDRVFGLP